MGLRMKELWGSLKNQFFRGVTKKQYIGGITLKMVAWTIRRI